MKNSVVKNVIKPTGLALLSCLSLQLLAVDTPKERENFHIFVLAGQSKSRFFLCNRETHRHTIFFLPCTFQWVRWKTSPQ